MDVAMSLVSGIALWLPLYALTIYMVWRRYSWWGVVAFLLAVAAAMGLADLVAGVFKHTGPLGGVWPSFPARERPMFCDALEGVHVPSFDHGRYGTVSAHAATIISLALLSSVAIAHRWFTAVMVVVTLLVCYSRIYLACHFPQDILLGAVVGLVSGGVGVGLFGYIRSFRRE